MMATPQTESAAERPARMIDLTDQLVQLIRSYGPLGLLLVMVVENLIQVVPSLVLLPMAGFGASRGLYPLPVALVATIVGSLSGCLIWFGLGRGLGEQRLDRILRRVHWLGLTSTRLRWSRRWFRRHDWRIVCWGRLIPVLRTNVSLPAGLARMPLGRFLFWSTLGTTLWNGTFVALGWGLGRPSLF
jgi:membrane protein DedA with SNARE-associated domain